MQALTRCELRDILVDPLKVAPRAVAVREEDVERLAESIRNGANVPPLLVAKVAVRLDETWTDGPPTAKSTMDKRAVRRKREPWANLPSVADYVLVDGHRRFHALLAAGKRVYDFICVDEEVRSWAEVAALALAANQHQGRAVDDTDMLGAFTRIWLNRDVSDSNETWRPVPGALSFEAIAAYLQRSQSWCEKMRTFAMTAHRCRLLKFLPVGEMAFTLRKALEVARVPESQQLGFVWEGSQFREHLLVDVQGRLIAEKGTVVGMKAAELHRVVDRWLAAGERVLQPVGPVDADTLGDQPNLTLPDTAVELPGCDWDQYRDVLTVYALKAADMTNPQLEEAKVTVLGTLAAARRAREELDTEIARRKRLGVYAVA
jgi:hypothetical protein